MGDRRVLYSSALIALVGCGHHDTGDRLAAAEAPALAAAGEPAGFLRALPEACEYLSEALARELLQSDVSRRLAAGGLGAVEGSCAYSGPAGSGKSLAFGMYLWSLDMLDSRSEPRESLVEKVSFLASGQSPVSTLEDVGNIAFVFDKGDSTSLIVLTGIGGTAVLGDRIVSELSLSYELSEPGLDHAARLGHILGLADDHLGRLRALAADSH